MLQPKTIDIFGQSAVILGWEEDKYFQTLEHQVGELALYDACLPENGVVYDIGANIGLTSIAATQRGCRVFAFEPAPRALEALRANTLSRPDVSVVSTAIGASSGRIAFTESPFLAGSHVDDEGATLVSIRSLDDWRAETRAPLPDLVKIDVEGHEPAVLDGALQVFATGPLVLMEVNAFALDAFGGTSTAVLLRRILERFGRFEYLVDGVLTDATSGSDVLSLTHRLIVQHAVPCWTDIVFSADPRKLDALRSRLG